jgi:hypothetical protein
MERGFLRGVARKIPTYPQVVDILMRTSLELVSTIVLGSTG